MKDFTTTLLVNTLAATIQHIEQMQNNDPTHHPLDTLRDTLAIQLLKLRSSEPPALKV